MIKKTGAVLVAVLTALMCAPIAGCGGTNGSTSGGEVSEIVVVSPFDSSDGNHDNYVSAYSAFEAETGYQINDQSSASNEEWKKQVVACFEEGNEPDVLFFFTGADANALVEQRKVVSISEIRKEYPNYASNMKDSLIPVSPVDGRQYAVPVNGYWEALYVNTAVLEASGVAVPGVDYRWEQFLQDCEAIQAAGYTPIACSLSGVPHYWFEYCTLNNGTVNSHTEVPLNATDDTAQVWTSGLEDIKDLYERGFFPEDTLSMSDDESCAMMLSNEAAFLLDGSWKLGWLQQNAENLEDYTVVYPPAKDTRKTTDIVSGLSMGYYITQQAWNDPAKREACVAFIEAMTTDEVVTSFGATSVTALKEGLATPEGADSLTLAALAMLKGVTGTTAAAQDSLSPAARDALFAEVPRIVLGEELPQSAIEGSLAINSE